MAFEVKTLVTEQDQVKLKKISDNIGLKKAYLISKTPVELDNVIYPWLL